MRIFIEVGRKNIRIINFEAAAGEDYAYESLSFAFSKMFQVLKPDSILSNIIAQVAQFQRFEAGSMFAVSCLVFSRIACLFLAVAVQHMTWCVIVLYIRRYNGMSWIGLCPRPTKRCKLPVQIDGHRNKLRNFRADLPLLSMDFLPFRNRHALRVFPAQSKQEPSDP